MLFKTFDSVLGKVIILDNAFLFLISYIIIILVLAIELMPSIT